MDFTLTNLHEFSKHAGKTLNWIPNDAEIDLKERLEDDPSNESLLHYRDNPIEYTFNNYGFRTNVDFHQGIEGNIFLGCSHTFGTGHYLDNVWSYRVNKKIKGNYLNLSIPGTGIGTCTRLLEHFKDILKPKSIFLFAFHPYRYEYYDIHADQWLTVSPSFKWLEESSYKSSKKRLLLNKSTQKLLLDNNNMEMYFKLHYSYIKTLAKHMGAQLYTISPVSKEEYYILRTDTSIKREIPSIARDNHMPVSVQDEYVKRALYNFNNNIEPSGNPDTLHLNPSSVLKDKPLL